MKQSMTSKSRQQFQPGLTASIITLAVFLSGGAVLAEPSGGGSGSSAAQTQTLLNEPVDSGLLIAPDFKFTEIGGDFASLGGGYGGWVLNRKLLVGGGAYTLLNGSDGAGMTYGGGVVEYFINSDSLVNVSVRGLVGGGSASLSRFARPSEYREFPLSVFRPGRGGRGGFDRIDFGDLTERLDDLTSDQTFFVFEPEVDVMLNVTEKFRLSFGGGYRFTAGADGFTRSLNGFAASVALKMTLF